MAEWSKALRSGRSPLMRAWVRIPLLTQTLFGILFHDKIVTYICHVSFDKRFEVFLLFDGKKSEL